MESPKSPSRKCFEGNIYIRTPLVESIELRKYCAGRQVYLKMENCQPSGSFKLRGISNLCKYAVSNGFTEVVCPSDGDAGLATAFSAMKMEIPCHIIVGQKTPMVVCDAMRSYGATLERYGDTWEEANKHAIETITNTKTAFLVHPFDHLAVWQGHSTIIDEIVEDLDGQVPSIIVTSCGGGGLICGLVQGIRRHGWEKRTKILAIETEGTHSFNLCVKAGGKRVRLNEISSIVHTLGAYEVCEQVVQYFRECNPPILSRLVNDAEAAEACIRFANDHRCLVGLGSATTMASVYTGIVERILTKNEDLHETLYDQRDEQEMNETEGPIVILVCGGGEVNLNIIEENRKLFNLHKI
ncbi:nadh dehydrogenase [Dermatophagoides farinae]|uniref:L-serine ammonia-lyase n=2 Tax=Dermatophagoides farinae TaxID=6954 RepID=A0A9D4NRZ6_DERFA|nr:nadh dehydrogenase [Dermatophagoides farinae]